MAYDAYNGQFLWETKNPGAMRTGVYNARVPGNMAAIDDYLVLLLGSVFVLVEVAMVAITPILKLLGSGHYKGSGGGQTA